MITSAITIHTHVGKPNTFLFRSASKLPLPGEFGLEGLLGDDDIIPAVVEGLLGIEGLLGAVAPYGELGFM
ncbi:hypothetical protein STIV2_F70 [Sulfolobus turreted icosahedral virus 2]|uniref:Uncharacterized protein n=1 Tax=Sulfolobus turreted icosahedral virus 2 TaxID=754004 RepID=D5IEW9_9VIRU|nr:hypothetical protein STIV2_F70 [Sulfolobus turreted icosahedral virus 2]ADF27773.1 hypothetical protein STIV2_F70 [Sulfolobus turreted icosahedral virus 2]